MAHKFKKSTRKDRRQARDRQEVLQAAARLFAEMGYSETGMVQIAEAADFSVGKLYTLFPNKEGLFVNLVSERFRVMHDISAAATDPKAPPIDQLRQRIRSALQFFAEDPHFSQIFMNEFPTLAEGVILSETQRHAQITAGYLKQAMDQGSIAVEDPEALAAIISAFISGLVDLTEMRNTPLDPDWVMDYIERFILKPLEMPTTSS